MPISRADSTTSVPIIQTEAARPRTTPTEDKGRFSTFMSAGARAVLGGATVGATFAGGPIFGAAVHELGRAAGVAPTAGGGIGPGDNSTLDEVRSMQTQSQEFNLEYLNLQEEVQQENRRFSTLSNVLKAKHETAKSAIANVRA